MSNPSSIPSVLDREFLPIRAKILEIAASLDRAERVSDNPAADPRWQQLETGINLLLQKKGNRAEQVQLLFSRPYETQWRQTLKIDR